MSIITTKNGDSVRKYVLYGLYWRYITPILERIYNSKMKRLYPDYVDDAYNAGELKFVWGVRSWDDLSSSKDTNFYTMNDIDIHYDRKRQKYGIGIETAYHFDSNEEKCRYLRGLLEHFTEYMVANGLSTEPNYLFDFSNLDMKFESDTIEELYTRFKIVVDGFVAQY